MRTKTRNASAPKTDSAKPEAPQPLVENNDSEGREKTPRISFNLTSDGLPDFSRMQSKTREQLTDLLKNKSVQDRLGFSPDVPATQKESLPEFDADEANGFLDLLGKINGFAASKVYKIPMEVCDPAFTFTPEQRKKIEPKLTKLLNKWGPMVLKTWKDEIGLGIVVISSISVQVRMMHYLEAKRKRELQRTPTAAPAPTPIRPEPPAKEPEPEAKPEVAKDMLDEVGLQAGAD